MTTLIAGGGEVSRRGRPTTAAALSPSRALAGLIAAQRDRWALWLAPAMIAGAAWWLLVPVDPPIWLGFAALAGALGAMVVLIAWPSPRHDSIGARSRQALAGLCALLVGAALGAVAAQLRTAAVAQAPYVAGSEPVHVQGWVTNVDSSDSGPRLRVLVRANDGVSAPPRYVRVAVRQAGLLTPGRFADCRAVLGPPSGPMAPGAYDFARRAYFERLGATGYAFGRCRPLAFAPPPSWLDAQRLRIDAMRADFSAAIQEAAPGPWRRHSGWLDRR